VILLSSTGAELPHDIDVSHVKFKPVNSDSLLIEVKQALGEVK
jgi:hypothetical protein